MSPCLIQWQDEIGPHRCDLKEYHDGACKCRCQLTMKVLDLASYNSNTSSVDDRYIRSVQRR